MVLVRRSVVAGAALLLASVVTAHAGDLYSPRGLKDDYAPVAYAPSPTWYLRGDYSYAWTDASELSMPSFAFSQYSVDNSWAAGVGVGRYFGRGVRGDITYEWRGAVDVTGSGNANTAYDIKSQVIMANLYYDFRAGERFTPYVGVGLGAVHHDISGGRVLSTCGGVCNFGEEKEWKAAGALMTGFSFRIDQGHRAPASIKDGPVEAAAPGRLYIDVGYRFLYLGDVQAGDVINVANPTPGPKLDDLMAHEFRVGLRWDLR